MLCSSPLGSGRIVRATKLPAWTKCLETPHCLGAFVIPLNIITLAILYSFNIIRMKHNVVNLEFVHKPNICSNMPLYSLKQGPRAWHSWKITQYLHWIVFRMSKFDNSLYVITNSGSPIVIILYVDDLVIWGEHLVDINKVKVLLSSEFEMTDMK